MKLCKNSLTLKKVVITLSSLAAFVYYEQSIGGVVWAPGLFLIIFCGLYFALVKAIMLIINCFSRAILKSTY